MALPWLKPGLQKGVARSEHHGGRQVLITGFDTPHRTVLIDEQGQRLAGRHAALQREPVALPALVREVLAELQVRHPQAAGVHLQADPALPALQWAQATETLGKRCLMSNSFAFGGNNVSLIIGEAP